jgi:hypothetical protein
MSVKSLAERYNQFQHDFGQGLSEDFDQQIDDLFHASFKKVANGQELVGKRDQLLAQLRGVKEFAGNWTIDSLDILACDDQSKCTIRYILTSEKAGQFEVIAIMSAQQGRIESIIEVFYQIPRL